MNTVQVGSIIVSRCQFICMLIYIFCILCVNIIISKMFNVYLRELRVAMYP